MKVYYISCPYCGNTAVLRKIFWKFVWFKCPSCLGRGFGDLNISSEEHIGQNDIMAKVR